MRIPELKLVAAAETILRHIGESEENASIAARALVRADMRGVSTHGVNLLRMIYKRAEAGMLAIPTRVSIVAARNGTAVLDGNNGLGQVAGYYALDLSIQKAKACGIAMVELRNTNNIGALGCLTELAASRDKVISICMTNGNPSVAPFGAGEPFFGTNPLSIAVPVADRAPIVLDMSSSVVARGKIRLASLKGEPIPLGWALNAAGEPTTDPKEALKGCLVPLGGPKGSGLAMMVDILAGVLAGAAYSRRLKSFHELEGPTGVGASFIAIDIGHFTDPEAFCHTLKDYVQEMKSLRRQPGIEEILAPGELEQLKEEENRRLGIEVPDEVLEGIRQILHMAGSSLEL
ncbi:MAG: Ldh family oxidoreductase [Spirochaetales bacterium]|nr:Ldh family oxidoreductase [Spirochaetales bacterium]